MALEFANQCMVSAVGSLITSVVEAMLWDCIGMENVDIFGFFLGNILIAFLCIIVVS